MSSIIFRFFGSDCPVKGPFINDVMLNWTFLTPPPPSVTLCHKKEDPPLKMTSQINNPPPPA